MLLYDTLLVFQDDYGGWKKMKILLTQFMSTPIVTAHLANALSKEHEISVLIPERLYYDGYFNKCIHIELINAPKSYRGMLFKTLNPFTYYNITKKIDKISPDVIHITWDFIWYNMLSPFLKKYPLVLTDEEPFLKVLTLYGKTIYKIAKQHTWRMPDAIIVHGEKGKDHLVNKGVPESKIHAIPLGVYSYYTKWMKKVEEERSILLFGAVEGYKGLKYLIKASPIIISSFPNAKIIIAGKGSIYQKYKKHLDKDYFEIHNRYILDEEVACFFQRSAVVVLPYIYGSNSGVIPVAYAFGKPVIATDVGSVAEPIDDGKTGFVIPRRDEKALAGAVTKLLESDKLRNSMRANIQRKVEEELSWDKIAEKIIEVYEKAIASHKKVII